MGGFFGTVSKASCVTDLFYGTDYNSHLGTKRGGLATYDAEDTFGVSQLFFHPGDFFFQTGNFAVFELDICLDGFHLVL